MYSIFNTKTKIYPLKHEPNLKQHHVIPHRKHTAPPFGPTQTNQLLLFKQTTPVYSDCCSKSINTLHGRIENLLLLKGR